MNQLVDVEKEFLCVTINFAWIVINSNLGVTYCSFKSFGFIAKYKYAQLPHVWLQFIIY